MKNPKLGSDLCICGHNRREHNLQGFKRGLSARVKKANARKRKQ